MAATPGQLPEFDPTHPEKWEVWVEHLTYFVEFQDIDDTIKKKAMLLSSCGIASLELAQDLIAPTTLKPATFDSLIK
ncbi:UNVERIFIED_CONTAM: hypothetical protein K2H54_043224, partial [Gekko kuhli]